MTTEPWQLRMFRRSLKKRLKLKALLDQLGDLSGKRCLLVTCGDNNGALNWHFRECGGDWCWAELAAESIDEMRAFLQEPVALATAERLPFGDRQFDCVVSIDVLEHLENDGPFLSELHRVLRRDGRAVVTVPNGDPRLLANRVKQLVGMTPRVYGHTRAGYTVAELRHSIEQRGLTAVSHGGYSRFFTEMVELVINFGYVFVLSGKKRQAAPGPIAPASSAELKSHGIAYRLYSLAFPLMFCASKLDLFLPASTNNAVIVTAVKGS